MKCRLILSNNFLKRSFFRVNESEKEIGMNNEGQLEQKKKDSNNLNSSSITETCSEKSSNSLKFLQKIIEEVNKELEVNNEEEVNDDEEEEVNDEEEEEEEEVNNEEEEEEEEAEVNNEEAEVEKLNLLNERDTWNRKIRLFINSPKKRTKKKRRDVYKRNTLPPIFPSIKNP